MHAHRVALERHIVLALKKIQAYSKILSTTTTLVHCVNNTFALQNLNINFVQLTGLRSWQSSDNLQICVPVPMRGGGHTNAIQIKQFLRFFLCLDDDCCKAVKRKTKVCNRVQDIPTYQKQKHQKG